MATAPVTATSDVTGLSTIDMIGTEIIIGDVRWAGTSITYSFPDVSSDYEAGYFSDRDGNGISAQFEYNGFLYLDPGQVAMMQSILDADIFPLSQKPAAGAFSVEGLTNLKIDYVSGSSGDGVIRIANTYPNNAVLGTYNTDYGPSSDIYGGDIFLGSVSNESNPGAGSGAWFFAMRSVGHALGLTDAAPTWFTLPVTTSIALTVMANNASISAGDQTNLPQTFMMHDIAALQSMYGADFTTNSGNSTYTWDVYGSTFINGQLAVPSALPGFGQSGKTYVTIWDGGGIDTYDFSLFASGQNQTIDLRPGAWSTFSTSYLGQAAPGNVANALLYQGDLRSLIENVIGTRSNDEIIGNQVANVLDGSAGSDNIKGLEGNDILKGGLGSDTMDGGDGIDTVDYTNLVSSITVTLGAGAANVTFGALVETDSVVNIENVIGGNANDRITGNAGENLIRGGAGSDTMDGGAGTNDTVDFSDRNFKVTVTLNGSLTVDANFGLPPIYAEIDKIRNFENVIGTGLDDSISGDGNNNWIEGRSGLDILNGNGGNDTIDGGNGNDTINAGSGDDLVIGSAGNDAVNGSDGFDILDYISQTASITAVLRGATASSFTMGGKTDTVSNIEGIIGGSGNDTLTGFAARESLNGGGGNDLIVVADGDFTDGDSWDGGAGIDRISFASQTWSPATAGVIFNLIPGIATSIVSGIVRAESMKNFENFTGSQGNETILGTDGANDIRGEGGFDLIVGLIGNDVLDGGAGNDTMAGGAGNDTMNGGDGIDTADFGDKTAAMLVVLNGSTVANVIIGTETDTVVNIENLVGGAGNDSLTGDALNNVISGGGGNDRINDGAGADTISGGDGNDTFLAGDTVFSGDVWNGGDGIDMLDYSFRTWTGLFLQTVFDLAAGTATRSGLTETFTSIENFAGSSGAETIYGADNVVNTLNGYSGDDYIDGRSGNDVIYGGDGADELHGGEGDDVISDGSADGNQNYAYGEGGNDFLSNDFSDAGGIWDGGSGVDTIQFRINNVSGTVINLGLPSFTIGSTIYKNFENVIASNSAETIIGSSVANIITAGGGQDTIDGGLGSDTLDYSSATAVVTVVLNGSVDSITRLGGINEDTIRNIENVTGGSAGDRFTGDSERNTLNGLAGNDILIGNGGNDVLTGGIGNDLLSGGAGNDIVDGGAGVDTADYSDKTTAVIADMSTDITVTVTVGGVAEDTMRRIENIIGGSGNDQLTGSTLANTLRGGDGSDTLKGWDGNDLMQGGVGFDNLDGGNGIDTADFSDRTEQIEVTLNGSAMAVVVIGGFGEDTLRNVENVVGTSKDDTIEGDILANVLNGGRGNDLLKGAAGDDTLIGGAGTDILDAGSGINRLIGGVADDIMISGGNDTFVFDTALALAGVDIIRGFDGPTDTIELSSAIFSAIGKGALQATAFVTGPDALDAGDRIIYNAGQLFYDADGNGSGQKVLIASFESLAGAAPGAGDFMII